MINYFTGRPRNGKSLHMAEIIYKHLKKGKNVIANFEINESTFDRFNKKHPGKLGKFIYMDNFYWLNNSYKPYIDSTGKRVIPPKGKYSYLDGLYGYALQFHERDYSGKIIEDQTLLVLDECQTLFNSRSWNKADRLDWCNFFREHGKLGYDVYLISQDDMMIDKQIRSILQYRYEHRLVNNYKLLGKMLGFMAGGKLFVCIKSIYGLKNKDSKIKSTFFTGKQIFYDFYDSYKLFYRGSLEAPAGEDNR